MNFVPIFLKMGFLKVLGLRQQGALAEKTSLDRALWLLGQGSGKSRIKEGNTG